MLDPGIDFSRYDFVWGTSESLVPTISANNSLLVTSKYIPWNRDPEAKSSLYWRFMYPDWILYKCDRVSPAYLAGEPNMPLDFSNPKVIEWQYDNYAVPASTKNFDAIAADNFSFNNDAGACGIWKGTKWIRKYTGDLYDQAYADDALRWLIAFRNYLQTQSPPLGFGVNFSLDGTQNYSSPEVTGLIDTVDYVLDEKGFSNWGESRPGEMTWLNTHYFAEALQQKGKAYFSINEFKNVTQENKEWAIASYLMSNQNLSSVVALGVQQYGYETYLPEYARMNIGFPLDLRTKVRDIYYRPYSNGLALVNPHNNSRTVSIVDVDTRDVSGKTYFANSPILLPAFSGKVLALAPRPPSTTLSTPSPQRPTSQPSPLPSPKPLPSQNLPSLSPSPRPSLSPASLPPSPRPSPSQSPPSLNSPPPSSLPTRTPVPSPKPSTPLPTPKPSPAPLQSSPLSPSPSLSPSRPLPKTSLSQNSQLPSPRPYLPQHKP